MRRKVFLVSTTLAVLALAGLACATAFALPEFLPNPEGKGIKISGTSGKSQWQTIDNATIKCESDIILGDFISPTHAVIDTHYEKCKHLGFSTNSVTDAVGVILIKHLALVCYISKAAKTVGLIAEVNPTVQIETPTAKIKTEMKGSSIAEVKPVNIKQTTSEWIFSQKEGKPGITKCEGGPEAVLLIRDAEKEFRPAGQEAIEKAEFSTAIEVMA
jgi:hypothetical protein